MISTLKPRFRQYKTAWFVKEGEDVNKRKPFRYTIVNEAEKAYSQVVRNLVLLYRQIICLILRLVTLYLLIERAITNGK